MMLMQQPEPGSHLVMYAGDVLELVLKSDSALSGRAYVRTNFGDGHVAAQEIVNKIEKGEPLSGGDWKNLEMQPWKNGSFRICFPLCQIGVFEFKCFFRHDNGSCTWIEGDNLHVKVEPAISIADNTIYNTFVRQFGPNISGGMRNDDMLRAEDYLKERGYTVLPPSGTFMDVKARLDHIMGTLGFNIIMFLPIHPAPSVYGRMGRFGSPFAPLDFYSVDASMAVFDESRTPMDQFVELLDSIHGRGGLAFIDLPLDHTGWASTLQTQHPEWFLHRQDGAFESPGAWGVVWADLCKLDFSKHELWTELANVVLHWCRLGVDGFRCDAGYMIPENAWKYITAKVRLQYPDTIFLLEGLGGDVSITAKLLESGCMNWAYSEFFQSFGLDAERAYLDVMLSASSKFGTYVNFAETHDNNRLAASSEKWARLRTASAALLAPAGAFGIANGVEWLASEKIDVHNDCSLNWNAGRNIIEHIATLNRILRLHPAFGASAELKRINGVCGRAYAMCRRAGDNSVLVVVNPDMDNDTEFGWRNDEFPVHGTLYDLLGGQPICPSVHDGCNYLTLPSGTVLCLSDKVLEFDACAVPPVTRHQYLKYFALSVIEKCGIQANLENIDAFADCLGRGTSEFFGLIFGRKAYWPVIEWNAAYDSRRCVMLPTEHVILVKSEKPFRVSLAENGRVIDCAVSVNLDNGMYIAILSRNRKCDCQLEINATVFNRVDGTKQIVKGRILALPDACHVSNCLHLDSHEISNLDCGLCTNTSGSYSVGRAAWGTLQSKYDSLLAANLAVKYPDDRVAMLLRFRCWLQFHGFSTELSQENMEGFDASYDNTLTWHFNVPCGYGVSVRIKAVWTLDRKSNAGCMSWIIEDCSMLNERFEEDEFTLIIRPDVDWRSVHSVTRAYSVNDKAWENAVRCSGDGRCMRFAPYGNDDMSLKIDDGCFKSAPQWSYDVFLPIEAERHLEDHTDIFSPGYFEIAMSERHVVNIDVAVGADVCTHERPVKCTKLSFGEQLARSLDAFVVRRDEHSSVIAGYPWFLDWGRDTLICLRGMIAAGMYDVVLDTIQQFASFERNGTLPNMIRGKDTSDRATSDAPLWLYVTVDDYMKATGDAGILNVDCGGRRLIDILDCMAESMWNGAENGVRADAESALLFSLPHYTWMDTNYPAATPRCGYPVEIQALWSRALAFLAKYTGATKWSSRHDAALDSISRYFVCRKGIGISDCLHCNVFSPAAEAVADDACRPNQLLAVTLNAIADFDVCRSIVQACSTLIVPGGIRSLADRPVQYPLPVSDNGRMLNDPRHPYWGHYLGDEDTRRKPAYHNGTCWGWCMPLYCEAEYLLTGERKAGLELLSSANSVMSHGCLGYIPEIYDGDAPHVEKGCFAQAWSMSEFLRVWKLLGGK